MATADRLREGVDFLARDFLGDVVGQQARSKAAVFGLFTDQQGGGADGKFGQLPGGCAGGPAGKGWGGLNPRTCPTVQSDPPPSDRGDEDETQLDFNLY